MWVWERLLSQYKTHPFTRNFVDGLNLQVSQRDLSRLFVYSSSPHRLLLLICGLHILQFCHVIQFLYLVGLKLCHSTVCSLCSQVGTLQCNISRTSDFCQLFFQILIRNLLCKFCCLGIFQDIWGRFGKSFQGSNSRWLLILLHPLWPSLASLTR